MTDGTTRTYVARMLSHIEDTRDVTVLYACESGSRAWGFESKDSDYDVRFIYVHDPLYYLSIAEKRKDTIEFMDADIDYVGWDLRKALRLFRKSNPNLYEWLTSPVEYRRYGPTYTWLLEAMPTYFSPKRAMYHYYHMARGNFRDYLQGDVVWTKKYFYVLRPIMACLHIEQGMGMPPVLFEELMEDVIDNPQMLRLIRNLVHVKRTGAELRQGPRIDSLSEFIEAQLARMGGEFRDMDDADNASIDRLNGIFSRTLVEMYRFAWQAARRGTYEQATV